MMLLPLAESRDATLRFVQELSDEELCAWPDPAFSPLCWHLGHIAFTEAQWVFPEGPNAAFWKPYYERFAQDGCAKARRAEGYDRNELFDYLAGVRGAVTAALSEPGFVSPRLEASRRSAPAFPDVDDAAYLVDFLSCHEHQHRETMALMLSRLRLEALPAPTQPLEPLAPARRIQWQSCEGGVAVLGQSSATPFAYDNEVPAFETTLAPFRIAKAPVSVADFYAFQQDGGYDDPSLWTEAAWRWRCEAKVQAPLGWHQPTAESWPWRLRLDGWAKATAEEPVCGVGAFEADAYVKWVSRSEAVRLPSEAEWQWAAQHWGKKTKANLGLRHAGPMESRNASGGPRHLLGNVWEWTSSLFEPHPGFQPFPYAGYSQPYFDGNHRVMRGGSFATDPAIARPGFRNWYEPWTRQCFVGLRLAANEE